MHNIKYKIVIFDLDGTLLNTLDDLTDSCNFILEKNKFPLRTKEQIKSFIGNGIPKLIERCLPINTEEKLTKSILTQFVQYYNEHSSIKTCAYDGILELLQKLKTQDIKIAVNTNKNEQTAINICNKYFPNLIDFVSGGKENHPHKPNPLGVFFILEKFNLTKKDALFIGDSDTDFLTAQNADIDYIICDWGFRSKEFLVEHGVKNIVSTVQELKTKIL